MLLAPATQSAGQRRLLNTDNHSTCSARNNRSTTPKACLQPQSHNPVKPLDSQRPAAGSARLSRRRLLGKRIAGGRICGLCGSFRHSVSCRPRECKPGSFQGTRCFLFASKSPLGHIQRDVVSVGEKKMCTEANQALDRRPIAGATFGRTATLKALPVDGCY